jgi:hypothetical protein
MFNCVCHTYVCVLFGMYVPKGVSGGAVGKTFCPARYAWSYLVEFHAVLRWDLHRRWWGEFNCGLIPGWGSTVQTGCEVKRLFYPKGTGSSLPGDKTLDMSDLLSLPYSVEVKNVWRFTSSSSYDIMTCLATTCLSLSLQFLCWMELK